MFRRPLCSAGLPRSETAPELTRTAASLLSDLSQNHERGTHRQQEEPARVGAGDRHQGSAFWSFRVSNRSN